VEETIELKVVCRSNIDPQHCNRLEMSPKDSEIKKKNFTKDYFHHNTVCFTDLGNLNLLMEVRF
jgi:hypothetical protein